MLLVEPDGVMRRVHAEPVGGYSRDVAYVVDGERRIYGRVGQEGDGTGIYQYRNSEPLPARR